MNGYRKMMMAEGGNLGWCKPISFADGAIKLTLCEGVINGIEVDGKAIESDVPYNPGYSARTRYYSDSLIERLARRVNKDYDDYSGYTPEEILFFAGHEEMDCCDCPFFSVCDAMDNPDDWEDEDYPDDD